ncbi:hypothetical protein QUF76_02800 [Desulfobacterales bacterium HSG16]|nr:hypothetical protein [Desulfobacterales bacterium HSG16]
MRKAFYIILTLTIAVSNISMAADSTDSTNLTIIYSGELQGRVRPISE